MKSLEQLSDYEGWIVLIIILVLVGTFVLSGWLYYRSINVIEIEDAGKFENAIYSEEFIKSWTTVRTSTGIFIVDRAFQIIYGNPAEIRTYQNNDRSLCDKTTGRCNKLL